MAYLTKQQVKDIITNAPEGTTPEGIVDTLIKKGHQLEGYEAPKTQTPTKTEGDYSGGFDLIKAIGNIPKSAGQFVSDIGTAITHPIETVGGIAQIGMGAVEKLLPGEQAEEQKFNQVVDFFKERYGGLENIQKTAQEDPVGFASDLVGLLSAGGGLISKVGKVSKIGSLEKAGQTVAKVSKYDPTNIITKPIGSAIKKVGEGLKLKVPGKVDTETIESAKRLGISEEQLPASMKTTSPFVPLIETFGAKGVFGDKLVSKFEDLYETIGNIATDIVSKADKTTTEIGKSISEGFDKYKTNWIKKKNELYENIDGLDDIKLAGKEVETTLKTKSLLDDIIAQKKSAGKIVDAKDISLYNSLAKKLSDKKLTAKNLRDAVRELNEKITKSTDPVITGNKATLQKVVATMQDDLDEVLKANNPELFQEIQKANDFYKKGLDDMNSKFGTKIKNLADTGQFDKIADAIFNPNMSVDEIETIFKVIGEENKPAISQNIVKSIIEEARKSGNFTPTGISRQLYNYGDKLKLLLDENQMTALNDLDKIAKAMGRGQKVFNNSQTAFILRAGGELATGFVNPLLAISMFLGDAAFSKIISSSAGQKFLSTGLKITPTIKQLKEVGLKIKDLPMELRQSIYQAGRQENQD